LESMQSADTGFAIFDGLDYDEPQPRESVHFCTRMAAVRGSVEPRRNRFSLHNTARIAGPKSLIAVHFST
jgi:hypothetical protein